MAEGFVTMASDSMTNRTFRKLCGGLARILPEAPSEMSLADRIDQLIPYRERRRVWCDLREAGFGLPGLCLSGPLRLAVTLLVLAPVASLTYLFGWIGALHVLEFGKLAYWITRPWAVHPPIGCETVQEAVLHLTPFRQEDYAAGLWPREDIAAKVRWMFCQAAGRSFETVTEKTVIADLVD
jgi:hypothetical protein